MKEEYQKENEKLRKDLDKCLTENAKLQFQNKKTLESFQKKEQTISKLK
eukprot:CAMPEP_0114596352 /NCGR_PEP_ID=MMETSP0125-20121206/18338_1 /TAXON_ID=485358 ORGANISM="Aristerostoma sp., Strain ATCC 50986" /NCGR_SAMPLE_ID=MMETSP0125 /ASSEMBLY_ACC=CAM_ASM_000245 /LENGTH=48 /DNA_ID= /DNA_START= /DNA_END= /DNA_ORIENTATION=